MVLGGQRYLNKVYFYSMLEYGAAFILLVKSKFSRVEWSCDGGVELSRVD